MTPRLGRCEGTWAIRSLLRMERKKGAKGGAAASKNGEDGGNDISN